MRPKLHLVLNDYADLSGLAVAVNAAGARRFLNGSPSRRVVVPGESDQSWDLARVIRLRSHPGLEEIRRAIDFGSPAAIGGGP